MRNTAIKRDSLHRSHCAQKLEVQIHEQEPLNRRQIVHEATGVYAHAVPFAGFSIYTNWLGDSEQVILIISTLFLPGMATQTWQTRPVQPGGGIPQPPLVGPQSHWAAPGTGNSQAQGPPRQPYGPPPGPPSNYGQSPGSAPPYRGPSQVNSGGGPLPPPPPLPPVSSYAVAGFSLRVFVMELYAFGI